MDTKEHLDLADGPMSQAKREQRRDRWRDEATPRPAGDDDSLEVLFWRYRNDPYFHSLVDAMRSQIRGGMFSAYDFDLASELAGVIEDERKRSGG